VGRWAGGDGLGWWGGGGVLSARLAAIAGVVGVAGVGGGDEGAFAGAGDQGPVVAGFELVVVVVGAEQVELVEEGVVGFGPAQAVVALEVGLGGQSWAAPEGYSHPRADCRAARGWRPRWATPTTVWPLVQMAATKGSPRWIRSSTTETGTGP
jgi:hypothetical protein